MAIEELLALVSPPRSVAAEVPNWDQIERAIGTRLPADYRAFALHYGSGRFEDGTCTFWVINPLSPNYPVKFAEELDLWRFRREAFPSEYPADIFPVVPGLLPWGRDEDGGMMGWLVEGDDPDRWAVVAKNRNEVFERFDLSLTTFLARSLTHELRPSVWRPDYPEEICRVVFHSDLS
jgi:hypothetical protein